MILTLLAFSSESPSEFAWRFAIFFPLEVQDVNRSPAYQMVFDHICYPKMVVPPVIHIFMVFYRIWSIIKHSFWGSPHDYGNPLLSPASGRNHAGRGLEEHGADGVHGSPRDRRPAAMRLVGGWQRQALWYGGFQLVMGVPKNGGFTMENPTQISQMDDILRSVILVVLDGFQVWEIGIFNGMMIMITLVQPTKQQKYDVHLQWWQSIYGSVGANVEFTATLHSAPKAWSQRDEQEFFVGKRW